VILGYCNLGSFDDASIRSEIGYGFNRDEWNKGYATEVIKVLVKFGFEVMNFNRIEATVTLGNEASIKAVKKQTLFKRGFLEKEPL